MKNTRTVRRTFLGTLCTIALAVIVASAWLLWPVPSAQFRGTPERTGYFPEILLPEKPSVLWSFPCKSIPHDPIVVNGVVYAGEDLGNVLAIDARTGQQIWQHTHGHGQIFSSVTAFGDRLYFTCHQGAAAVSRKDGRLVWEYAIPSGAIESSPLRFGETLYVGGNNGRIYAWNAKTGKCVWDQDIMSDSPDDPSPEYSRKSAKTDSEIARPRTGSTDGKTLFQPIFDQSRLVALDAKTGGIRWSFQARGWIFGEPTVTDQHVFIGSQDKNMYCLDKQNGNVVWTCTTGSRIEAGAATHDGWLYFGSCDKRFYCVDANTGKVKWSFTTDGVIYSSPLLTSSAVVFGSFDGYVYALNVKDGSLKWKIQPHAGSSIVSTPSSDGRSIFVTTSNPNAIVAIAGDSDVVHASNGQRAATEVSN